MGVIIVEFYNELLKKTMKEYFYNLDSARITVQRLKRRDKVSNIHIYSLIDGHKEELW